MQGYGTSSTAATERVQRRGEETAVIQHLPGGLEEATKTIKEKAPIMYQLVTMKLEVSAPELQTVTTTSPILNRLHLYPAPHRTTLRGRAVP